MAWYGLEAEEYDMYEVIAQLEKDMEQAARNLQFEKAIVYREQINKLKALLHPGSEE